MCSFINVIVMHSKRLWLLSCGGYWVVVDIVDVVMFFCARHDFQNVWSYLYLVSNFGMEWKKSEVETTTQYKAFMSQEIKAKVGVKIGLRGVNVTLKGIMSFNNFSVVYLFIYLFLFTYLSIYLFVCLFVCLLICLCNLFHEMQ